jgi:hypothetical protein
VDPADEYADTDPSALTDFREPLAPYGVWVTDATYGTVWVPNATVVGADFAPYQTAGHWAMTDDDEWLWVSDYDWGYVPFHYGRWIWINARGWSWIPGRVYAPAWVSWRVGDAGYIGWAPMPPSWYWYDGYATNLWMTPYAAYCFVPTTYVFHEHVDHYVVRDAATVRSVAAATRAYTPAHPTVKGGAGAGAGGGGGSKFRVASPSMMEARVPSAAAPKARVTPDMRSKAFATHSGTAAVRQAVAAGHGFRAGSFPISSLPSRRSDLRSGMSTVSPASRDVRANGPVLRTPREAPAFTASPSTASQRSAPVFTGRSAERSAPTFHAPPASRPSFSPPPSTFHTPSSGLSSGSRSSSGFSVPSHVSTPSRPSSSSSSPSSTSHAPSPSHSSSSGGHSSGGGHRR